MISKFAVGSCQTTGFPCEMEFSFLFSLRGKLLKELSLSLNVADQLSG